MISAEEFEHLGAPQHSWLAFSLQMRAAALSAGLSLFGGDELSDLRDQSERIRTFP